MYSALAGACKEILTQNGMRNIQNQNINIPKKNKKGAEMFGLGKNGRKKKAEDSSETSTNSGT